MLNAADLASMRRDMAEILLDTCTLLGRSGTAVASNVRCSVTAEAAPNRSDVFAEINQAVMVYILSVPYDTALAKDMRVVHNGYTYEIDELMDDQTPLVFKRARMSRTK